jgi:hypothetical protein
MGTDKIQKISMITDKLHHLKVIIAKSAIDDVNRSQYIKSVQDSIDILEEYRDHILNTVTMTGEQDAKKEI